MIKKVFILVYFLVLPLVSFGYEIDSLFKYGTAPLSNEEAKKQGRKCLVGYNVMLNINTDKHIVEIYTDNKSKTPERCYKNIDEVINEEFDFQDNKASINNIFKVKKSKGVDPVFVKVEEVNGRNVNVYECHGRYKIKGNIGTQSVRRSMIYHVEENVCYEVTIPERCYEKKSDAKDDGFRAVKRNTGCKSKKK